MTIKKKKEKFWQVPVTWEVNGHVSVVATTLQEAIERFNPAEHDLPDHDAWEYVEGSFRLNGCEVEIMRENKEL